MHAYRKYERIKLSSLRRSKKTRRKVAYACHATENPYGAYLDRCVALTQLGSFPTFWDAVSALTDCQSVKELFDCGYFEPQTPWRNLKWLTEGHADFLAKVWPWPIRRLNELTGEPVLHPLALGIREGIRRKLAIWIEKATQGGWHAVTEGLPVYIASPTTLGEAAELACAANPEAPYLLAFPFRDATFCPVIGQQVAKINYGTDAIYEIEVDTR